MNQPRTLPLFDPDTRPQSWNERMAAGEYAVLYSSTPSGLSDPNLISGGLFCTVFSSLAEAEEHATRQVTLQPTLRCRIYDHHGLAGQPASEICGSLYKGEKGISPRFRRWCGSVMFFGGVLLIAIDWQADFTLLWPGMFGMRMVPVGLFLLATEAAILIGEKRRKSRPERSAL